MKGRTGYALSFVFLVCAVIDSRAQNTYAQKQYDDYKKFSQSVERAFSVPSSSNYKSPSSSSSNSGSGSSSGSGSGSNYEWGAGTPPTPYRTPAEREADLAQQRKEAQDRINAEIEWENKKKANQAAHDEQNKEYASYMERNYVADRKKYYKGPLDEYDQEEMFRDQHFEVFYEIPPVQEDISTIAYEKFLADSAKGSYDSLIYLASLTFYHPHAGTACLNTLERRFPEKKEEIELKRMGLLMFYLGARRPNVHNLLWNYPETVYESDMFVQKELIKPFIDFARKYPDEALVLAGKCRAHLNPFEEAAGKVYMENDSMGAWCFKALFTVYDPAILPKVDASDKEFWRAFIDRRFKEIVYYTTYNRLGKELVMQVTVEQWLDIFKRQAVSPELIVWAYRYSDDEPDNSTFLPNLYKAAKEAKKKKG